MGYTGKGEMVAVLWSLMPDGQREMMVAGFFMIIDARWANQRIRLMKFPFFSPQEIKDHRKQRFDLGWVLRRRLTDMGYTGKWDDDFFYGR